ncbi:MAG: AgmX/PglI C-terminal domain-containing protein [Chitinivibrionales bacterium]
MEREANVIVAGTALVAIDRNFIKAVRGSPWRKTDTRFLLIALLSIGLHAGFVIYFHTIKIAPATTKTIEEIPERFAKLIIEKPIPKEIKNKPLVNQQASKEQAVEKTNAQQSSNPQTGGPSAVVKQSVARQVARVEQKIRTVGVLGMLTGVGTTAKGPSVVDVLGSVGNKKEHAQDLDKALADMSGLQQSRSIDIMQKKLVKSKDVEISHKESIDDLIAGIGAAKTSDLSKRGDIIISRPESIEGAASSNAKRDITAINAVVASHKVSVRMSYERFLKKIPDLAGKITIRFTIDAEGNVTRLEIMENTTGNKELEDEIMHKVKMWKFETIPEGEVTVTYPLVFQPA